LPCSDIYLGLEAIGQAVVKDCGSQRSSAVHVKIHAAVGIAKKPWIWQISRPLDTNGIILSPNQ
jgi:hypothetical protein